MLTQDFVHIHKDFIEKSKNGDRKSQFELYKLYAKAMFNILVRMLNNREEAEDLLQEAFTEAFKNLNSFRYESTFGAWLKRIVVNKCINELKRRKTELVLVEDVIEVFDGFEEDEKTEEDIKYEVEKIRKAVEKLPDGYRVIFSLYLLEGYDHSEISEILGISESTSKSQFLRAKAKVKELLGKM
jgi:RNA polymerase sigma-70 factor (ECF subfamily)